MKYKALAGTLFLALFVALGILVYRVYAYPTQADYASSATIVHTCLDGTYSNELLEDLAQVHRECRKSLNLDPLQCDLALCHYLQAKFDIHPSCDGI